MADKKLIVLSTVHNVSGHRKPVYEMFLIRMKHLREKYGVEMLVVGSEGEVSEDMTREYGSQYLEYQNKPVSNKWNAGMQYLRQQDPDYVMSLDSDDFISDSLMEAYLREINEDKYGFIGVGDSYFVSFHLKRAHFDKCFYWPGYKGGSIIMGCSKVIRRDVLDNVEWHPWPDGKNYSLNNHQHQYISKTNKKPVQKKVIKVGAGGHLHIDIKTNGNISSISPLWKQKPLLDFNELMREHLPAEEAEALVRFREKKIREYAAREKRKNK